MLADDFGVSFEQASLVPTVMQAGYACGIILICPLGDVLRRRPLTLLLVFVTTNIVRRQPPPGVSPLQARAKCTYTQCYQWLGLCLTTSFNAFLALSFLAALTTVTPQIMLPLVAELAAPKRKAMMISVVFGGLYSGVLLARILSGVVTEFTTWRAIYFISFGLQYLILILLFFFFPDYPAINPDGISYLQILWTMVRIPLRQPLLVQTSLISFFCSATFVAYWTTLTFLLASPPYNLSTLVIGLFALIGIPPFLLNPIVSHRISDRFHPSYGIIAGVVINLAGVLMAPSSAPSPSPGPSSWACSSTWA